MGDTPLDGQKTNTGFIRGLGLLDSTMIVAGSMIGSGIFIVSGGISKQVGSPGWLLVVWIVTGLLTLMAALSYGELAAMMPKAGGQYVYLREAFSPMWGFLYGWTLFLVIQTGTIAAVAVGLLVISACWFPQSAKRNTSFVPSPSPVAMPCLCRQRSCWTASDCPADFHEHARSETRQARSKHFHNYEDWCARWINSRRHCFSVGDPT